MHGQLRAPSLGTQASTAAAPVRKYDSMTNKYQSAYRTPLGKKIELAAQQRLKLQKLERNI